MAYGGTCTMSYDELMALKFAGSHYADFRRFEQCHAFIVNETNPTDQRAAVLAHMSKAGMGIDTNNPIEALSQYMDECRDDGSL